MELIVVVSIIVCKFYKVFASATLAFQKRFGGTTCTFRREGIAASNIWMTVDLERRLRATTHTDIRAFKEAKGRIEVYRFPVGQVR